MKLIKSSIELIKNKENLPEEHQDLYFAAKYESERNEHLLSNSLKELLPNEEIRFKLNKYEEIDKTFETVTLPYRKYIISKAPRLIKYKIDYSSITNKDKFFNIFEGRLTIKIISSAKYLDELYVKILEKNYSNLKSINLFRPSYLDCINWGDDLEFVVSNTVLNVKELREKFEKQLSSVEYNFYRSLFQGDVTDMKVSFSLIPENYIKSEIYFTGFKDELETLFKSPFCSSILNRMECRDQLLDLLK